MGMLGASASNPKQYADCNIAQPSAAGKEIIRRLQAYLQQQVPNSNVKQTGFLDQQTCRAWQVSPAGKFLESLGIPYPANFNITNILDTLDGATANADGTITHHWVCNGPQVTPDCTQVPMRTDCGPGQVFDSAAGKCISVQPTAGKKRKKSNLGLLLLGGAAAAGIALAAS